MMSRRPLGLTRLCLLICSLASTPALTGCGHLTPPRATPPPPPLQVQIPATVAAPCPHPDPKAVRTIGDLATYAIAGEADLKICDAYRAAAVEMVRAESATAAAIAKALTPARPWWRLW